MGNSANLELPTKKRWIIKSYPLNIALKYICVITSYQNVDITMFRYK